MDDPGLDGRLDDSGEGTLERPHRRQQPLPPPRVDSYRFAQRLGGHHEGASRSGSNSEVYERLEEEGGPDGAGASRGGVGGRGGDNNSLCSDDSDAFSSMDRRNGAGGGERLVKPSQIKSKKRQQGEQLPDQA